MVEVNDVAVAEKGQHTNTRSEIEKVGSADNIFSQAEG